MTRNGSGSYERFERILNFFFEFLNSLSLYIKFKILKNIRLDGISVKKNKFINIIFSLIQFFSYFFDIFKYQNDTKS